MMKEMIKGILSGLLVLGFVFVLITNTLAAKPTDTCNYVVDGNIPYPGGHYLATQSYMPGYDTFGYNYQGHIFNGSYANAYLGRYGFPPYAGDDASYLAANPTAESNWVWPYRNVQLQMKWSDAWLANSDCGSQGPDQGAYTDPETPDGVLDRHYPTNSYIGSGAWLTNHATGTYESSEQYNWDVSGGWVIAVNGGAYNHDYTFVMTSLPDGTFTGTGGYPAGAGDYTFDEIVINGQITGNTITFTASYYVGGVPTGYSWNATGTIDNSGQLVSGTGTSGVIDWHSTAGTATKVYKTCEVSDFVKIVAAPSGAHVDGEKWYAVDGTEIGPVIWGSFAIIQGQGSDPCGEYGVIDYLSPLRAGLGNW